MVCMYMIHTFGDGLYIYLCTGLFTDFIGLVLRHWCQQNRNLLGTGQGCC